MNQSLKALGATALLATVFAVGATASATAADAVKGQKIFKRCTACHSVGPEAKNKLGPPLNGLVGRPAGLSVGFKYGSGIVEARGDIGDTDADGNGYVDTPEGHTGLVWTEENLMGYLLNPKAFLIEYTKNDGAKVRMAARVKKEEQRADIIAYLKTIGLDGNPIAE